MRPRSSNAGWTWVCGRQTRTHAGSGACRQVIGAGRGDSRLRSTDAVESNFHGAQREVGFSAAMHLRPRRRSRWQRCYLVRQSRVPRTVRRSRKRCRSVHRFPVARSSRRCRGRSPACSKRERGISQVVCFSANGDGGFSPARPASGTSLKTDGPLPWACSSRTLRGERDSRPTAQRGTRFLRVHRQGCASDDGHPGRSDSSWEGRGRGGARRARA